MASLLAAQFREAVKKSKDPRMYDESNYDWQLSTGFLPFDFANGNLIKSVDDKGNPFEYYSVGVVDGSINMCIGRSGSGKTTFAIQAAANIIRPFPEACMFFDSLEGGISQQRLELLTGFQGEECKNRIIQRNSGITAENFYERVKIIYEEKLANRDDMMYNTGLFTSRGEPIIKMIPTVYVLDSLALLMPEKYSEEDELSGQMSATASAKANTALFKRLTQMIKSVNIIIFVINHITEDVSINPMQRKKASVAYLKQGEALPGGKAATYLTNNLIRFDDHTKFKEDEGFRIRGNLVNLELVKSRTAAAGTGATLVFNQLEGFDPELSLFVLMKDKSLVSGAGLGMYLADRNDMKFSQKNLKEKLRNDMEFRELFMKVAMEALKTLVRTPAPVVENKESLDLSSMIMNELRKEV